MNAAGSSAGAPSAGHESTNAPRDAPTNAPRRSPVVHVVSAGEIGGAERMLADLASDRAHRSHVVALSTPNERLHAFFRDAGLDVVYRGPTREGPLSYLASSLGPFDVAWVERVVRERRAGIVHLHTFASQVLGTRAALRAGARVVRTEHSTRVFDDPSCWVFSRWSLRRADVSVSVSEHLRTVTRAHAPWASTKTCVVPNGVDVTRFAVAPVPAFSPPEPFRFVALGRLDRRKGLDIAFHALADVPGAVLHVVGEGSERAALVELARTLGIADRVQWTGHCDDVRAPLTTAHAALSSARTEGLGIALLEAMACGRPVVALPVGGVPEFVHEGTTGWLAPHADAISLAATMRRAMQSSGELERRGQRARALVVERYSLEAMREGYERIYAKLDRTPRERPRFP